MKKVVYMGTPDFAVPALKALVEAPDFEVVGVVTNPDQPSGRGKKLSASPVKQYAIEAGIEVFQPKSLKKKSSFDFLKAWQPDFIVVAAYGKILPQRILDIPPLWCLNIHALVSPKY